MQVVVGEDGLSMCAVLWNNIAHANSANISDCWKTVKLQESMLNWHHVVLSTERVVLDGFTMGWESIPKEDFAHYFQNIGIESIHLGHSSWYRTETVISLREPKFDGFDFWRLGLYQSSTDVCGAHLLQEKEYSILQVTLLTL